MENKSLKIGVFGLGLIGGSILKSLFALNKYFLVGVSKSSYQKASSFADVATDDINELKGCDIVFVCSKMSDTPKILSKLEDILGPETIVADVCSIKGFLNKEYRFNFILSHPMAGTEFKGFENSFDGLFKGAKWITGKKCELLENVIKELGAVPVLLEASFHDKYAAEISHLPMLISLALFASADDEALKIASSGFRDTTRLSMTNPDLAYDMLNLNRKNILFAYEKFIKEFEKIKNMDEDEFKNYALNIAQKRTKMYDENGKNIF